MHHTFLQHDLEKYPIQLKTDSATDSGQIIDICFFKKSAATVDLSWNEIGYIWIKFAVPMQYRVYHCTGGKVTFKTTIPTVKNKIWTIIKTSSNLIIRCNEVEVVNIAFDEASDSCREHWSRDVDKIAFWRSGSADDDTATDEYRAIPPCHVTCIGDEEKQMGDPSITCHHHYTGVSTCRTIGEVEFNP